MSTKTFAHHTGDDARQKATIAALSIPKFVGEHWECWQNKGKLHVRLHKGGRLQDVGTTLRRVKALGYGGAFAGPLLALDGWVVLCYSCVIIEA